MYCGSCLRDNALAAELLARGHDVLLTPVYTPTRTDERNVSGAHVFFGGISVYLEQHASIFRHTPRLLDRLWDSTMGAAAGDQASNQSRSAEPRRADRIDAARRAGISAKGNRQVARLAAPRAAVRRGEPAVRAAARPRASRCSASLQAFRSAARCRARICSSMALANRTGRRRSS